MSIVASRWADSIHAEAIVNALKAIANRPIIINGVFTDEGKLQNHAVDTLYLYGVGIACIYYRKYELLDRLFRVKLDDADRLSSSYLINIANCWLIDKDRWNSTSQNRLKTPFSWLASDLIRPMFTVRTVIPAWSARRLSRDLLLVVDVRLDVTMQRRLKWY